MLIFFTSVNNAYLSKISVLGESLGRHHPDAHRVLALLDEPPAGITPADVNFDEFFLPHQLGMPELERWLFGLTVVEACTAQKGIVMTDLLNRPGCEGVVFLDPDIEVFSRLVEVEQGLTENSVLLTPHLTHPETTALAIEDNEIAALTYGVFNIGFLALAPTDMGRAFTDWWRERLLTYCVADVERGLFTDQRWVNLAPGLFDEVAVLRHDGYNVATWNVSQRQLHKRGRDYTVNGVPLRFVHFSGLDSGSHARMLDRYAGRGSVLSALSASYQRQVAAHAARIGPVGPWRYGVLRDGTRVEPEWRTRFRLDPVLRARPGSPFQWSSYDFGARPARQSTALQRLALDELTFPLADGLALEPIDHAAIANEPGNPLIAHLRRRADALRYDGAVALRTGTQGPVGNFTLAGLLDPARPTVLMFTHGGGGGVDVHRDGIVGTVRDRVNVVTVSPVFGTLHLRAPRQVRVAVASADFDNDQRFLLTDLTDADALIAQIPHDRIHVHHPLGMEAIVKRTCAQTGVPYDVTVQDHFLLSWNWNQAGRDPDEDLAAGESPDLPPDLHPIERSLRQAWGTKAEWLALLHGADRIDVPSHFLHSRLTGTYPELPAAIAFPPEHPAPESLSVLRPYTGPIHPLRIAVLGPYGTHKGAEQVAALVAQLAVSPADTELHVISAMGVGAPNRRGVTFHGAYRRREILSTLGTIDPHLIWLPSVSQESYGLVLSEALLTGRPILANAVGAYTERCAPHPFAEVMPLGEELSAILQRIEALVARFAAEVTEPAVAALPLAPWQVAARRYYPQEYLAWLST
ncbi:MAG: hypothetical protein KGP10_08805 [Actinomycetales bacterium]|nr:hypothetical protein [Actinomycetales bacterium]